MSYGYDLEAAKAKLPSVIDEVENFVGQTCNARKDSIMEAAKAVNADKLTKICEQACEAIDATSKAFRDLMGADGDSVTQATLHGMLASVKKMDEALNG